MPTNNTFASTKNDWKRLADIDYFGMYVKAYIPFNAWMNINYEAEKTDRDKISAIRGNANPFKNKIVSLIEDDDQAGEDFRTWIGSLHAALEQARIYNKGNYISFTDIVFKMIVVSMSIEKDKPYLGCSGSLMIQEKLLFVW